MNWIIFSVSAHFFWAVNNLMDKYIVDKKIKNPYIYIIWTGFFSLWSLALIPFIDFYIPAGKDLFLIFLAALAAFCGCFAYIKAVKMEEITRINIMWQLIPVFTFILAWIFFREMLSAQQLLAFVIFLIGGIIASLHIQKTKMSFSKAFWWMALTCLFYSFYAIILDSISVKMSAYLILVIFNIFDFLLSVIAYPFFRKQSQLELRQANFSLFWQLW